MLLIAAIVFLLIGSYVSLRQYAMLSKGGSWSPRIRRVHGLGKVVVPPLIALVVLITSFP